LESALKAQIADLGLQDRVLMSGPMSQDDIKEKIKGSALLAAPCVLAGDDDRDGLPTILLEAMALGTPCISTPVTGIPEVLKHEETGLMVSEGNALDLADACQRLLEDRRLGSELVSRARSLIEQRFDIDKNTDQLRETFRSVTSLESQYGAAGLDYPALSVASGEVA
jgi:glycosyltransferase involved in cell wall biosynthesis